MEHTVLIKTGSLTAISGYLEGPNIQNVFQRLTLKFYSHEFELLKHVNWSTGGCAGNVNGNGLQEPAVAQKRHMRPFIFFSSSETTYI